MATTLVYSLDVPERDMLLGPLLGFEVPLQYLVPWIRQRDIPNEGEVLNVGEEGSGEHSEGNAPMEIEGSTDNSQENILFSSGESDPEALPSTEVSGDLKQWIRR
ncbi:uncharacterized protein J3R85_003965 [Psidium guajava]|nr:uncharacterized protein J3R85_003965 [Psidium guajava]